MPLSFSTASLIPCIACFLSPHLSRPTKTTQSEAASQFPHSMLLGPLSTASALNYSYSGSNLSPSPLNLVLKSINRIPTHSLVGTCLVSKHAVLGRWVLESFSMAVVKYHAQNMTQGGKSIHHERSSQEPGGRNEIPDRGRMLCSAFLFLAFSVCFLICHSPQAHLPGSGTAH